MSKQQLDIRAPIITTLTRGTGIGWLRVAVVVLLDSLMISGAWILADQLGNTTETFNLLGGSDSQPAFLLPILVITLGICASSGIYGTDDKQRNYLNLLKSLTMAQVVLLMIGYLYEPEAVIARSTFLLSWFFTMTLVVVERLFLQLAIVSLRYKGLIRQRIGLVGTPKDIYQAQKFLQKAHQFKICDRQEIFAKQRQHDWSAMIQRLNRKEVNEVFICSQLSVTDQIFLYWELKSAGIHLRILPVGLELPIQWSEIKMVNGIPTMRFSSPPIIGGDYWLKRWFDLIAGSIILMFLSPILLAIAVGIKFDSPGPILYKQTRVGLKGRHFKVWKFRTMVANAEKLQQQLEAQNEMQGGVMFKMKDDPRVTRVGKFLRRYSLDELPQIFNVLRGEMSLVGPRPFPLRDVERFSAHHFIRQEVLPGITGLWQVSGRSDVVDFDDVFRLDLTYIQNWSIALDFRILFQTIKVVVAKEGAY
jgi:exopolysaccharide biosynthesis polyprenyl glycosylphosphotransferase